MYPRKITQPILAQTLSPLIYSRKLLRCLGCRCWFTGAHSFRGWLVEADEQINASENDQPANPLRQGYRFPKDDISENGGPDRFAKDPHGDRRRIHPFDHPVEQGMSEKGRKQCEAEKPAPILG